MNTKAILLILFSTTAFAGKERDGGFEYTQARAVLQMASERLSQKILRASDSLLGPMNRGWDKGSLADLIKNIEENSDRLEEGIGPTGKKESRIFSYETSNGQTKLYALKPFYEMYKMAPILGSSPAVEDTLLGIEIRLLHEASHVVWDLRENEALQKAKSLITKLSVKNTPKPGRDCRQAESLSGTTLRNFFFSLRKMSEYPERNEALEKFFMANLRRISENQYFEFIDNVYYVYNFFPGNFDEAKVRDRITKVWQGEIQRRLDEKDLPLCPTAMAFEVSPESLEFIQEDISLHTRYAMIIKVHGSTIVTAFAAIDASYPLDLNRLMRNSGLSQLIQTLNSIRDQAKLNGQKIRIDLGRWDPEAPTQFMTIVKD